MESQPQRWLTPEDWLATVRSEYLCDFIVQGGAAVKVVVPVDGLDRETVIRELAVLAADEGFIFACADAASVKIHLVDRLFNAIARQVPWRELASSFVRVCLGQAGYRLPDDEGRLSVAEIAGLNELQEPKLNLEIRRLLERRLWRDYRMCQEFRFAMIEMCLEVLGQASVADGTIEEWLRGELRLISALKPALIFQKIARHNARHMLISLAHWVRLAGSNGLALALDVSRYMMKRPAEPDGTFYYSRPATLDAYEVLRQLIDGTDDIEGCFVAVVSIAEFLSDEARGMDAYDALKLRIADEVHDRCYPNPLASLVRLRRQEPAPSCATEEASHDRG